MLWSDDGPTIGRSITSAALAAVGFGLFGLLDDLAGSTARRGYRGHVGALRQGELTTGLLKLVGGGLVAVVVAWPWAEGSLPDLVPAVLVVALAANLGNLLDRAPGRVGKVSLVAIVLLAVTSHLAPELTGPALVGGAGVGMLWPDLRERCMLGDTGSNVLGAGAGLGLVATTSPADVVGRRPRPRRAQPGQRGGQLQRRDRPDPTAALARPPRRPPSLKSGHRSGRPIAGPSGEFPTRTGRERLAGCRRPSVLLAPTIHGGRERSR